MRSRFKHFYFIAATLLLSLISPLLAFASDVELQIAQVQTAQDRKAAAERLIQEANSQFAQAESDEFSQDANSQLIERQYQKALGSFQQALSIYQELAVSEASPLAKRQEVQEVRRRQKDILFMIGVIYGKLGQYKQVLKYSQQVLALDQELGDRCQEQETLFRISSVYGVLEQYDQALEGLDKILAISRQLDEPCQNSSLLFTVRDVYQRLGQPEKALKTLEQLLAIARKLGNRQQERSTLLMISELYKQQGQYEEALEFARQALAIDRELGERSREPYRLIRIGEIYEQQNQYERALQFYQQALSYDSPKIKTLMSLSRVYQRLRRYNKALESYQQALAADRSASPRYDQSQQYVMNLTRQYIYMSLSQVYRELDRDELSRESYQQALAIGKKHGNIEPSMLALNDWGTVQVRSGQFQEALETFEKALATGKEVAQKLGNSCGSTHPNPQSSWITRLYSPKFGKLGVKCTSLMGQSGLEGAETIIFKNLGFVYRKLGQPEKSRESYEQALKRYQKKFAILRESNKSCWLPEELRIPREIAQVYEIIGEANLAREFHRQAEKLEFIQDVKGILCDSLGEVDSGIVLTDDDSSTSRQSK